MVLACLVTWPSETSAARAHLAACLLELGRRDRAAALLNGGLLAEKINPTTTGRLTSRVRQEAVLLEVLLSLDPGHDWVPVLAQRLNRGMHDGHWGTTLSNAAAIHALSRYQQWRRFDTATLVAGTDMVNKLFSNDNPLLRLGRDLGMGLVNSLPGLRRGFMREAAGLTGDLPRLLKGEAI